ncbi:isoleucine--tRNA ligase [Paenibacillus sp. WQ 127069]|uniref:Isoleucine--tRNA ligase n=1 Tax=Paenibacillus baimaensis TaxID=2982185 RepID=A0ABT2UU95_9BACL|nr:isoleucine--tRNA ligase [Paenibacillus sp. WQ 127069]MCU6798229.1 isoleucine--tRNA ligase [Paenibacillus sp. WQ 127069]
MRTVDVKEQAAKREKRVYEQWVQEQTFSRSINQRLGKPRFVFYEGPPTANGAPHIGHMLGRVIKDFICRYKTMSGYQVLRKAGWDTHGLPVELGVEKELGISGKQEIEAYGVEKFIEKCKASVFRYEKQWRELTESIGYWTDLDSPYMTLSNDYIESVWHILSHIHKEGLLNKGHRVSPYCPSCQTTLSSHELAQGYEDVKDLSATVKFRTPAGESFLAWTTTPWTLPANTALAVHPDLDYVKVKHNDEVLILAKSLLTQVIQGTYEIVSEHKGREFVGITYEAPYPSESDEPQRTVNQANSNAAGSPTRYIVIGADFVSDSSGTGIVHIAPAHGEDDYRAAQKQGIGMLSVVGLDGCYTEAVPQFVGRFVKDCDVDIVKDLSKRGLLFAKERYEHSYPFCWRCHTPLLYYAMESWFIRTTAIKEQMIANNRSVEWYPGHIREGRFGKFLDELVDWNISRNRYWGTPLNVWVCQDCGCEHAPASVADLRARSVQPLPDNLELHKPFIDDVKLNCSECPGEMVRTSEVIDVWFDSGSMPFAQHHYPFENQEAFADQFPADIICEGIDQTRGWFYSLLAVSTLFTGKAPYKAVMATGHILDENGQKMSKSKGNVIDPWEIIEEFGADAFRWALLADSAPWLSKRFSRNIVASAKSKVIDTLVNAHSFYVMYATIDHYEHALDHKAGSDHSLDRWIISRLNHTISVVSESLEGFDFMTAAQAIEGLVDEFSNWYIRRSRERFWGHGLTEDKCAAYRTMRQVLLDISRMIAPFTPFLADEIYMNLADGGSVHLADYPALDSTAIDAALEDNMARTRQIVELARNIRNDTAIKNRQPLSELIVITDQTLHVADFEEIIKDEMNVKSIRVEQHDDNLTDYALKMNLKVAGPKYGKLVSGLQSCLRNMEQSEIKNALQVGYVDYRPADGELVHVPTEEMLIERQAKIGYASATGYQMTVSLNTTITPELEKEGMIRELIRAVQDLRKKYDLPIDQRVELIIEADDETRNSIMEFESLIQDNVLLRSLKFGSIIEMEQVQISAATVKIGLNASV